MENKVNEAIILMISGAFCVALMSVLVKSLKMLSPIEIMFYRNIVCIIFLPLYLIKKKISLIGKNNLAIFLRCFFGYMAVISVFFTYQYMNLTDAIGLNQLTPIFVIFLSFFFLKEKILRSQISFFLISFLGALLIIRPGLRFDIIPALIGILGAIFAASSQTTMRILGKSDNALVITNYFNIFSIISSFIIIKVTKSDIFQIDYKDFLLLSMIGIIAMCSQILTTHAYKLSEAKKISIFWYTQLIFSAIFDIIVFVNIPNILTIIGCSLIFFGGYLNNKARSKKI